VRCISGPWINQIMDFLTCENQGAYSPGRLRFNGWLPYLPWLNMMNIHGPLVSIGCLLYFSIAKVKGNQVIRLTSLQAWPLSSEQTPYMPICQLFWSSAGVFGDLLQSFVLVFIFTIVIHMRDNTLNLTRCWQYVNHLFHLEWFQLVMLSLGI